MTVQLSDFAHSSPVLPSESLYESGGKRFVDVALVLLALPLVAPLLGLILLMTWIEGGSPLYVQRRVGVGGREFGCLKVRTMIRDADKALADLLTRDPVAAKEWHHHQKLEQDPRVTRLGRFLRQSSLDELPQLWNVLNGTMSLVGPRPFTPEQKSLYLGGQSYFALRPGITGLWQVGRRHAGAFVERVALDEEYGRRIGFRFDAWILWRTFAVVLRARGV